MKQIAYLFEFYIIYILFLFFKFIPINFVSLIGGKFFQIIGPFTKSHQTAISNIKRVFPQLNEFEITDNTEGSQQFSCMSGSCEV